jgi:L-aminopeptidase/D-esterase-like protein
VRIFKKDHFPTFYEHVYIDDLDVCRKNDFAFQLETERGRFMKEIAFTDIEGVEVGHAQNLTAATGCTVVICKNGAGAGVDVRGGAPGTRETDLLDPVNLVEKIHAVLLAGGSAFGLDAASGVMQFLEEKKIGFDVGVTCVPIVCGAVLFDLMIGDFQVRPDKTMGYQACLNAGKSCPQGNVGAGAGATVGKILGMDRAMKSGLGAYAVQVGELKVGALVAVNCLGDVIDPEAGGRLAGLLNADGKTLTDTEEVMIAAHAEKKNLFSGNTTLGLVATNAVFEKAQAKKVASMAHNGYARTMRPAHSMVDGDTIFVLSTGSVSADLSVVGLLAARVMERAVVNAVKNTSSLCGLKCWEDMQGGR